MDLILVCIFSWLLCLAIFHLFILSPLPWVYIRVVSVGGVVPSSRQTFQIFRQGNINHELKYI